MNAWPVIGHGWAVDLLAARLAHGRAGAPVLFTGPNGVGRTTLARAYAQALNCTGEQAPCGQCRACVLIAAGRHPDVQILSPQVGGKVIISEEIKIDQVRQLLHDMTLTPVEARRRVAIIRRAETANAAAANALLKTLEEPAPRATLLLTASSVDDLWPTVVSRCQVIPLRPLPVDEVERALAAHWHAAPDLAARLAHASGGRLGWAVRAFEEPERLQRRDQAIEALGQLLSSARVERFAYAEALARDSMKARETLDVWITWYRDILLLAAGSRVPLAHPERGDELWSLSAHYSLAAISAALDALRLARERLERNAQARLVLEVLMLDLPAHTR